MVVGDGTMLTISNISHALLYIIEVHSEHTKNKVPFLDLTKYVVCITQVVDHHIPMVFLY